MTYWSIRHVSSSSCSLVWKPTSFCQNSEIFALFGVVVTHWIWWCISGAMGYNGGGGVAMGAMVELVECGSKPAAHGARPPLTVHPTGQRWALSGQIDRYTKCMIVTPMFVTTSVWLYIVTPSVWLSGVECGCRYYLIFTWTHHPATARGQGLSSEVYPQPIAWSGHLSLVLRIELRPKLWLASVRHSQVTKSSLSKNLGEKPARL